MDREVDFIRSEAQTGRVRRRRGRRALRPDRPVASRCPPARTPDATGSSSTRRARRRTQGRAATPTAPSPPSARPRRRTTDSATTRSSSCPRPWPTSRGSSTAILLPIWLGATVVLRPSGIPAGSSSSSRPRAARSAAAPRRSCRASSITPTVDRFDTSSLRMFPCGGADVPPELIRRARPARDPDGPWLRLDRVPEHHQRRRAGRDRRQGGPTTDGRPIGANEVRIVDGRDPGARPRAVPRLPRRRLDAEAFTADGWFRTGDLGHDRRRRLPRRHRPAKDIMIRRGEKISAREVEDLLHRHPRIAARRRRRRARPAHGRAGVRVRGAASPRRSTDARRAGAVPRRPRAVDAGSSPSSSWSLDALPDAPSGKVDKPTLLATVAGGSR